MKRRICLSHGLAWTLLAGMAQAFDNADPTGTWRWAVTSNGEKVDVTLELKRAEKNLTGTIRTTRKKKEKHIDDVKFKDGEVTFSVTRRPMEKTVTSMYRGKLEGDVIKGKVQFQRDGEIQEFDWKAIRQGAQSGRQPLANQTASGKCVCSPASLFFGRLEPGQSATRTVKVTCTEKDVSLQKLEMSTTSDVVTIKKSIADRHSATLEITYTAPASERESVDKGKIKGISGGEPLFEISYLAIKKK